MSQPGDYTPTGADAQNERGITPTTSHTEHAFPQAKTRVRKRQASSVKDAGTKKTAAESKKHKLGKEEELELSDEPQKPRLATPDLEFDYDRS
jgi:hypothetical protein